MNCVIIGQELAHVNQSVPLSLPRLSLSCTHCHVIITTNQAASFFFMVVCLPIPSSHRAIPPRDLFSVLIRALKCGLPANLKPWQDASDREDDLRSLASPPSVAACSRAVAGAGVGVAVRQFVGVFTFSELEWAS